MNLAQSSSLAQLEGLKLQKHLTFQNHCNYKRRMIRKANGEYFNEGGAHNWANKYIKKTTISIPLSAKSLSLTYLM